MENARRQSRNNKKKNKKISKINSLEILTPDFSKIKSSYSYEISDIDVCITLFLFSKLIYII